MGTAAAAAAAASEEVEKSLELTGAVDTSVESAAAAADVAMSAESAESALSALLASGVLVGAVAARAAEVAGVEATFSAAATPGTLILTPNWPQSCWAKARVASKDGVNKGNWGESLMINGLTLLFSHTAGLLHLRCEGRDEGDRATDTSKVGDAA